MAKIVCVEDESDIREDIVETLEDAGYEVLQAENGRKGLEVILETEPDLILSDITMPDMNGHELLAELRENRPELAETPFVFLSALADRKDQIAGRKLGADDYLTKPIDFEMMLAVVDSKLQQAARVGRNKDRQLLKLYSALTGTDVFDAGMTSAGTVGRDPMTIVSVANDEIDLSEIHNSIKSDGHSLIHLSSGREFLDKVQSLSPDIALIGFNTVDLQAPLVLNMLRGKGEEEFPVVLLLPPTVPDFPVKGTLEGFHAHLRAPIDKAALMQQIRGLETQLDKPDDLMAAV